MTPDDLQRIMPAATPENIALYHPHLEDAMHEFDAYTLERMPAFIAHVAHESESLKRVAENFNYKPAAIIATFNTPRIARFTQDQAAQYGRTPDHPANQEMIANIAYANRMGNGGVESGDGWRYRGAGLIQLTGKSNQHAAAAHFGIDPAVIGDWLRTPEGAARSAGYFWDTNGLNALADAGDMPGMTRRINGGVNGLADRVAFWERAKVVLGVA